MYKKLLISTALLLTIVFSFSVCFANDGMQNLANDVKNVVQGTENAVENAGKGISNTTKDATGAIENKANELGNDVKDTTNGIGNSISNTVNNYNATRTSAETNNTFMGMNATAWTWLILGIAAVAIIGLVWYYAAQFNSSNYNDRD